MSDLSVKAQEPRLSASSRWVLWTGLLAAVLGYGAVGYFLQHARGLPGADASAVATLRLILGGLALSETAAIFALPHLLKDRSPALVGLIRWLMAESIAVYGLVLFVVGAPWSYFGVFLGWSLVLLAIHMPRD